MVKFKSPRDKIGVLIFVINLLVNIVVLLILYFMNLLYGTGYVFLLMSVFFAVSLALSAVFVEKYAQYFRKHSLIFRVILAIAFVLMAVALLARPTYYLSIISISLTGFDFTLAILFLVINDQIEIKLGMAKI